MGLEKADPVALFGNLSRLAARIMPFRWLGQFANRNMGDEARF